MKAEKAWRVDFFFKDRHYIYFEQTDRRLVSYSRSNFTEELGKAGWTELYFIIPTNIHTTGVRKPLVVKAGLLHSQTLAFSEDKYLHNSKHKG